MPQFEWQQEFDGTQSAITSSELVEVRTAFVRLYGSLALKHAAHIAPSRGIPHLNLIVDDPPPEISVALDGSVRGDPYILLTEDIDLDDRHYPWPLNAKISSWYRLQNLVVVRQDFDTRPISHPLAVNDGPLWPDDTTYFGSLRAGMDDYNAAYMAEVELGFDSQPVRLSEVHSLADYLQAARSA